MENNNTTKRAAETLIDAPIKIQIGQDTYNVKRPTLRTLAAVSAEIAKLPVLKLVDGKEIQSVISYAEHCRPIGRIFALLIHGARPNVNFWHKIGLYCTENKILDKYTPKQLEIALGAIFAEMELADFFALTTSLNAINLTRPTREVGKN